LLKGQRKRNRDKYLDRGQFEKLVRAAKKSPWPYAYALLYAAGTLGLRINEAVALDRHCFRYLSENAVYIPTLKRQDTPELPVHIGDFARKFFSAYLKRMPARQQYLFPGRGHDHISSRTADRIFKWCARKAGLPEGVSFHALRHHRGLELWNETRNMVTVRDELRHTTTQSTEIYVHMDESKKIEAARRIEDKHREGD